MRVRVGYISGTYGWVLGAVDRIQVGAGASMTLPLAHLVASLSREETRPVIAIGMASHEGELTNEEQRAKERADNLAAEVMRHLPQVPRVATLNLGYRTRNPNPVPWSINERPVALAVVLEGANSPDLPAVIGDALVHAYLNQRFPIDARDYSRFGQAAGSFLWVKN